MKIKKTVRKLYLGGMTAAAVNLPLLVYSLYTGRLVNGAVPAMPAAAVGAAAAVTIFWLYFNIRPYRDENRMPLRLVIMRGGRTLGFAALYAIGLQCLVGILLYPRLIRPNGAQPGWPAGILIGNAVFSVVAVLILLWNGILRMYLTSARLRVRMRLLMLLAMWIPVVNLAVLLHAMKLVRAEYDYACYKESVRNIRAESDLCRTKYPLIMVHGVGFRDLRYFNYWGRIPRELTRYGATVYYGNQEAFGTVAYSDNDGLVSTESAHWGEFRTVFESSGHRGISHGDMIDLKREDYRGFDVVECYVQIVSELAGMGF